jgi:hypothetical protein
MLSGMAEATEAGFARRGRFPGVRRASPVAAPAPSPPEELTTLRTVKRLAQELASSGLTEASIRWAIFHEETNGLKEAGAVVRPTGSRRVFLDREKYEQWLRGKAGPT